LCFLPGVRRMCARRAPRGGSLCRESCILNKSFARSCSFSRFSLFSVRLSTLLLLSSFHHVSVLVCPHAPGGGAEMCGE